MSAIKNLRYDSWVSFKAEFVADLFEGKPFQPGEFIFRGQSDDSWELESAFDRWFRGHGFEPRERIGVASRLQDLFAGEARRWGISQKVGDGEFELLALAQHYGLPTRLLDWSESPYVACFFAYAGAVLQEVEASHGCVWALRRDATAWSPEQGVSIVEVPHENNLRLRNQQGVFTLNRTPYSTLEGYAEAISGDETSLYRARISLEDTKDALLELDSMGVNHASAFPEATGCAIAAQTRLLISS